MDAPTVFGHKGGIPKLNSIADRSEERWIPANKRAAYVGAEVDRGMLQLRRMLLQSSKWRTAQSTRLHLSFSCWETTELGRTRVQIGS